MTALCALGAWFVLSLLAAAAWAEHQREWKRRRGTFTLPPRPSTPPLDSARLVQSLRARGYQGKALSNQTYEPRIR